jgi:hypothetical protein
VCVVESNNKSVRSSIIVVSRVPTVSTLRVFVCIVGVLKIYLFKHL